MIINSKNIKIDLTDVSVDYSKIYPENYIEMKGDYSFSELLEKEKELMIFRLKKYINDNVDYLTCGEINGINLVISKIISGKL